MYMQAVHVAWYLGFVSESNENKGSHKFWSVHGFDNQNLTLAKHCLRVLSGSVLFGHGHIGIDHHMLVIVAAPHFNAGISHYMVST